MGNPLRGDDGLGPLLSEKLYEKLVNITDKNTDNIYLLNCETTPENDTSTIRQLKPSHIIIVDAVEFDTTPGEIIIIDKNQIDEFNVSTHSMPISFLINYIEKTIGSKVMIIGIQPEEMLLINKISTPVKESVETLSNIITENI
ncbi:hydrogenase maturation peptidase HycI [Methanosphaera cuniculi]|uniref:hydrogenase maturation peptidase HycI n=1 Tax=Methanosphaera cuniculi TaxID=1077256 RepID=UPI0026F225A9|nr:hydrogenase maturation peptidase HycI [Methanosphaera cuniculi]